MDTQRRFALAGTVAATAMLLTACGAIGGESASSSDSSGSGVGTGQGAPAAPAAPAVNWTLQTAENAELSELVRVVTVMFAPVLGDAERPHVWNTVALRPDLTPEQAALIRDVCRGEGT
jgi:hypothetical protein